MSRRAIQVEQYAQTIKALSRLQLEQGKEQAVFITAQYYFFAQVGCPLLKGYAVDLFICQTKGVAEGSKFLLRKTGHRFPLPLISDVFVTDCHLSFSSYAAKVFLIPNL